MLSRVTPDAREHPPPPYDYEHDPVEHQRDDRPAILVPESQEYVSDDSQRSDGLIASSQPAQEAANPPAHPPPPSLRRRVRRVRRVGGHVWSPPSSEDSLEDFGESDSEEVEYYVETDGTGEERRFTYDNNGNEIPYP